MRIRARRRDEGQILVIFALSLIVLLAMVGLVLDGGSTFAQRRQEQNAVDLAAIAAANDLIANQGSATWDATARSVAAKNGYLAGTGGASLTVTCINCPGQALDANTPGVQVTVNVTAPHPNGFSAIVGMSTWNVSATATALTGWPDTATGPAPFIVSNVNFDTNGHPIHCTGPKDICNLSHPVSDTPTAINEFTWTNFGYNKKCSDPGNVNDRGLQDYINGYAQFSIQLLKGCYIAQHNDGVMNNIVAWAAANAPMTFPVPVVDANGNFVGWASFVMTSATTGGRNGFITGYFVSDFQNQSLTVTSPGFGTSTFGGSYELKLTN